MVSIPFNPIVLKKQLSSIDQLAQQFGNLRHDLHAICTAPPPLLLSTRNVDIPAIFESTPRKFVSSVQLTNSPSGTGSISEEEITTERCAVFGSRMLKGRSILEALEFVVEVVCCTCSSSTSVQGREEEVMITQDGGGCAEKKVAVRCIVSTVVVVMVAVIVLFLFVVM